MNLCELRGQALLQAMVMLREQERDSWSPLSSGAGKGYGRAAASGSEPAVSDVTGTGNESAEQCNTITVFHCTSSEAAESIMRGGFRFPAAEEGPDRGLKLGAAVYFGSDRRYCEHEALNTLEDAARQERKLKKLSRTAQSELRAELCKKLATISARVSVSKRLSLGDYDGWVQKGKEGGRGVNRRAFDDATENVTKDVLCALGDYEVITINEGMGAFEIAVYEPAAILPGSLELLLQRQTSSSSSSSSSGSGSSGEESPKEKKG